MNGIELTWAGGEHRFLLPIGQLRALQQYCDAGPEHILNRLRDQSWRVDDVVQTIRLALEGGGLDKEEARRLVQLHVEEKPLKLSVVTAHVVLASSLYGEADDPVGESGAGEEEDQTRSREANGDTVSSTSSAVLPKPPPAKSTK